MTYDTHTLKGDPIAATGGQVCITIIDTIILTNYTNDAYIFDTHTLKATKKGRRSSRYCIRLSKRRRTRAAGRCHIIIDTVIPTNYTNNAYIFDTYTPLREVEGLRAQLLEQRGLVNDLTAQKETTTDEVLGHESHVAHLQRYVSCITIIDTMYHNNRHNNRHNYTIIDTIIHHILTNYTTHLYDAYIYDTLSKPSGGAGERAPAGGGGFGK
jgi:hypothetical protein